jgi:hypothetical protein
MCCHPDPELLDRNPARSLMVILKPGNSGASVLAVRAILAHHAGLLLVSGMTSALPRKEYWAPLILK